jgi:multimeric flavodoxin WrbA
VNWYHVPSVLKLMIDRLVCADGGNPDPTRTHGKNAAEAKAIELEGWDYPKHLAGRAFAVVVHGDVEGAAEVRYALCDWLEWMGLIRRNLLLQSMFIGLLRTVRDEPRRTDRERLSCGDGNRARACA